MTIESDIYNLISPLVAGRVHPDFSPINTAKPFVVYAQVGGQAMSYVENVLPSKKHGRFQIDVYSNTRAECAAIALQIETLMTGASAFQARALSAPISGFERDTLVYSSMQDFSVFSER